MQNWFQIYKSSLNKEAGIKDFALGALISAVGLVLFHNYTPEEAASKAGLPKQQVTEAVQNVQSNKNMLEKTKEFTTNTPFIEKAIPSQITNSKPNINNLKSDFDNDQKTNINIIARTLWAEARGEREHTERGMRAIASVIYNRGNGSVPDMIRKIKAPLQFSCWNKMDWNKFTIKERNDASWTIAKKIAGEIVNGDFVPITKANHYYNPSLCDPKWSYDNKKNKIKGEKIGSHLFIKI